MHPQAKAAITLLLVFLMLLPANVTTVLAVTPPDNQAVITFPSASSNDTLPQRQSNVNSMSHETVTPTINLTPTARLLDLGTTKTLYTVANAHLDTQWNWNIQTTINSYINKTVDQNVTLFGKYPNYNFNFEGAFRYALLKEYYPDKYNTLKTYIAQGRWNVAGSSWDAGDVNVPSPEGIFRNILYGNRYFKQEFGKSSLDIFLPDCFGFGYALPSIAAHAGLKGFSTQKLTWGSAYGTPFDLGRWIGPDGAYIAAALKPGSYTTSFSGDLSNNSTWLNAINANGAYGVFAAMGYHGTGDTGGAPADSSASSVNTSVNGTGPVKVLSASTDQLFRDMTPAQLLGLPSYTGELVMTTHGTGSYTSRNISKRWNRQNEVLADATERAAVLANWLGGAPYPQQRLTEAWQRFIWHTFHDDLTGTSLPSAYLFSWNDYVLSLNQFAGELSNSLGAVVRGLDTQATGIPIVVYNPLAQPRQDTVEARVYFPSGVPAAVRVYDPAGVEVPSQKGVVEGNYATIIFLADMPPVGYKTYDVQTSATPSALATGLSVNSTTLESNRYRVTLNSSGDIASIIDKQNGNRELLASPMRLQMQNDTSSNWPSWEVLYNDVNATPREYVSSSVNIAIAENGPARVAVRITRTQAGSTFVQTIRLSSGGTADRIEIDNEVDWQTKSTLLKAAFPLSVSNARATYDLGLGTIQRGNNTSTLYEVPAQQWADLTASAGDYGVSILNDSKYGWDKPNNNTLRLTLIHTPQGAYGSNAQDNQDLGRNKFLYAIYGHAGNWTSGDTVWQAARLNQPLLAFQTTSHAGTLGKSYSFLSISTPQVFVKAIKKAEDSHEVIVRVQETRGTAASNVQLAIGSGITSAREVNAQEESVGSATVTNGQLVFNLGSYQPRTFALTLANPPTSLSAPTSQAVTLSYNKDVVSPDTNRGDGNFDGVNAIPAELFPSTITSEGIQFQLGPTGDGQNNALTASGQSLTLNAAGYKRLYLLAGSANGDLPATFTLNGAPINLTVQDMKAQVGTWDLRSASGVLSTPGIKRDPVAWVATHRHTASGNSPYNFAYLFKYRIDLPQGVPNPVLVLPSNSNILIFALTLSDNSNDDTAPAGYLYDSTPLVITPPAEDNLALNKPATADSSCNADEGPAKAVNGSWTGGNTDKWCSFGTTKWLQVDLGANNTLTKFVIKHAGLGGETTDFNTRDFNVQVSTDSANWSTIVNVTGNTASETTHNISAVTARYVRLNVVTGAQSGANTARIYELEVYGSTTPPSTNLALNKPATADSSCNANEGPAKAVNGSWTGGNTDKWCSFGATKWLQVDLGANNTLTRFVIKHAGLGGESTTYNTRDFKVQVSTDGTNWNTVVNVAGNTASETTHNITAVTAHYVRLNVVTGAQSGANTARIYELEVYGSTTPSTNLALNKPATADSSCNANEGPAKAVNGSWTGGNTDKWCSLGTTKWLQVDLGANNTLTRFVIKHAGLGGEPTTYNTRDFNVQVSTDGVNWTTVVNVAGNTASETTHNITAATARYVRLNVVTGAQSGANTARIYELEVY